MRNFPNYLRFYKDEWHVLEVPKVEFTKNVQNGKSGMPFYRGKTLVTRERKKKRRKRIPYPVKETGEDDLPICSIAQQRLAREGGTGFEQICSIELQTCFTLHSKYETTSISADRQTKIVVYALIQRFDFHELCNHEISLNGRFIHRYRVYRIS